MSWLDHVWHGRKAVEEVYATPPTLENIDLFCVDVNRQGPRIDMRFNLAEFADRPPAEWVEAGKNRVQVKLVFKSVEGLVIRGFGWTNVATIDMELVDEETLAVRVHGDTTDITFRCSRYLTLQSLSAYIHNPNAL